MNTPNMTYLQSTKYLYNALITHFKHARLLIVYLTFLALCASVKSYGFNHPTPLSTTENSYDECYSIPQRSEKICLISFQENEQGALMTHVSYTLVSSNQVIKHLVNNVDAGQYFCGIGFSTGGKYLYQCFSGEGHAYYSFYLLDDFIKDKKNAEIGRGFEDSFLDHIESFADNGELIYALNHDSHDACFDSAVEIIPLNGKPTSEKRCLKAINILPAYKKQQMVIPQPHICQHQ